MKYAHAYVRSGATDASECARCTHAKSAQVHQGVIFIRSAEGHGRRASIPDWLIERLRQHRARRAVDNHEIMEKRRSGGAVTPPTRPEPVRRSDVDDSKSPPPERKWRMTRIKAGDYVFPSNELDRLWRVTRYEEDGSIENLTGSFWALHYYRGPLSKDERGRVLMPDLSYETFWDGWDVWENAGFLEPTREAAIQEALRQDEYRRQREWSGI